MDLADVLFTVELLERAKAEHEKYVEKLKRAEGNGGQGGISPGDVDLEALGSTDTELLNDPSMLTNEEANKTEELTELDVSTREDYDSHSANTFRPRKSRMAQHNANQGV